MAIEWGKKHQIAKVGEIVISKLGGKRGKVDFVIRLVTIGRNAQNDQQNVGNAIHWKKDDAKGEIIDEIGTGRCLYEFRDG